jgi:N-acetylmuramic acid 6-phosphate etherase
MNQNEQLFLGIEGGGTKTIAVLANGRGTELQRATEGPANLHLLSDEALVQHLEMLRRRFSRPNSIAIGLAGAWTAADRARVGKASERVWPGIPSYPTHDLETAYAAGDTPPDSTQRPRVLLVSGTGSCCYGKTKNGGEIKVGGWGHVLGDKGSGYEIGMRALKATVYVFDRDGVWPRLGERILRALQLNEPNDLIGWAPTAGKRDIAGLAVEVFEAWKEKDKVASDILRAAANSLARDATICAGRITKRGSPMEFLLAGSVLLKQPGFARMVGSELKKLWPRLTVRPLERESVWGAVYLAQSNRTQQPFSSSFFSSAGAAAVIARRKSKVPSSFRPSRPGAGNQTSVPQDGSNSVVRSNKMSPTELRHPKSMNFNRQPIGQSVRMMLAEDATIAPVLMREATKIERAIRLIVRSLKKGGRLFYIGAGTSGRLGVLDASECPPTFRTEPEMVQGIIAGGEIALRRSVEGAEDDVEAGAKTIQFRGVASKDTVVGIAASGTTPYVWGGLREAKKRGASTILMCFNPYLEIPRELRPNVVIAPNLGPELLTGSTRMKAGTATKLLLNIFTTVAMVRIGKVLSNLMIDLHPANVKLRDRAARIVQELTGASYDSARKALENNGWLIKKAVSKLKR